MISFTKICSQCGKEKDLNEFRAQSASPDLHKNTCKSCDDIYQKQRYLRKKEQMKENAAKWRREHPEEFRAIQEKYRLRKKLKKDLARTEEKHKNLKNEQKESLNAGLVSQVGPKRKNKE